MKKALIIGIDHYNDPDIEDLKGCINDAERISRLLSKNTVCSGGDETNFECKFLRSYEPTDENDKGVSRALVQKHIKELFEDEEADIGLLYFAGHGFENSLGGYLATQDAEAYEEGVSVHDIMTYANNSSIKEIIIILDCCYSGGMGEYAVLKSGTALLRKGISILTSSGALKQSREGRNRQGIFTKMICDTLESGGDLLGNVKVSHLYEHADELLRAWDQRPYCKMNAARLYTLRTNKPKIDRSILRNLKRYFNASNKFLVDIGPECEEDHTNYDKDKGQMFEELKECFYQGLLIPIGEKNMYEAAKNSAKCKLTGIGMFYRNLAVRGAI